MIRPHKTKTPQDELLQANLGQFNGTKIEQERLNYLKKTAEKLEKRRILRNKNGLDKPPTQQKRPH